MSKKVLARDFTNDVMNVKLIYFFMIPDNNQALSITFSSNMENDNITNPSHIVAKLIESKNKGTVIGICSPVLSSNMMTLTCVKEILLDDELIFVLMPYDIHGNILPTAKITLEDIKSVKPFTSKFQNPFISKLGEEDVTSKSMLA